MLVPFSWLWQDPAESLDRFRALKARMEKEEAAFKERERKRKARRIRQVVKQAMSRQLKGQQR